MSKEGDEPDVRTQFDGMVQGVVGDIPVDLRKKFSRGRIHKIIGGSANFLKQRNSKIGIVTAVGLVGVIACVEPHIDALGDMGRSKTDAELTREAQALLVVQLKAERVNPEALFRAKFMGTTEEVGSYAGANGFLGAISGGNDSEEVVAFQDCLDLPEYDSKDTKSTFELSRFDEGRRVFLTVNPTDDAFLHFEYVADPSDPTGFNLIPMDLATFNELGFRGCKGYINPITQEINP